LKTLLFHNAGEENGQEKPRPAAVAVAVGGEGCRRRGAGEAMPDGSL
jgi:hypothetical protein